MNGQRLVLKALRPGHFLGFKSEISQVAGILDLTGLMVIGIF